MPLNEIGIKKSGEDATLLVTDIPFWKADLGNRQRILSLVKYLHQQSITFMVLYLGRNDYRDSEAIEELELSSCLHYLDDTVLSHEGMKSVAPKTAKALSEFYDHDAKARFDVFLSEHAIGKILVEYIHLDYLVSNLHQQYVTIIDTHDLMSRRARHYELCGETHHIIISEAEEMALLDQYDYVIAIQQNEYDSMKSCLKNAKVIMVPHAVEPEDSAELVFVSGTAQWKSIVWFIEEVWPRFAGTGMVLHIYGNVCKYLKKYVRVDGVFLHGTVTSLDTAYGRGGIAINPVQFGGGLKIKSVEALAYGLPLVATSEGVNGLEKAVGKACLLANTREEWIEALSMLLFSRQLRTALSYNGLCYAHRHFMGTTCYSEIGAVLCGREEVQQVLECPGQFVETEGLSRFLHTRLPEFMQRLQALQERYISRPEVAERCHVEYIGERSFELFKRYQDSRLRMWMQGLKKVPLLGNALLYFKRKVLKWDM